MVGCYKISNVIIVSSVGYRFDGQATSTRVIQRRASARSNLSRRPEREAKMVQAIRQMTLTEFLKLPEEKPALEFEEGKVIQKVAAGGKHSRLQGAVCEILNEFAKPPRTALAFLELRTTFGGRSYV